MKTNTIKLKRFLEPLGEQWHQNQSGDGPQTNIVARWDPFNLEGIALYVGIADTKVKPAYDKFNKARQNSQAYTHPPETLWIKVDAGTIDENLLKRWQKPTNYADQISFGQWWNEQQVANFPMRRNVNKTMRHPHQQIGVVQVIAEHKTCDGVSQSLVIRKKNGAKLVVRTEHLRTHLRPRRGTFKIKHINDCEGKIVLKQPIAITWWEDDRNPNRFRFGYETDHGTIWDKLNLPKTGDYGYLAHVTKPGDHPSKVIRAAAQFDLDHAMTHPNEDPNYGTMHWALFGAFHNRLLKK